ncbi:MAG: hypothetical protein ACPGUD_05010 [Parashewanella sp.]
MNKITFVFILIAVALIGCASVNADSDGKNTLSSVSNPQEANSQFLELLQNEITNRAFAYETISTESRRNPESKFWKALLELETLTKAKFESASKKYQLSPNKFVVFFKSMVSNTTLFIAPETSLKKISSATDEYLVELKKLQNYCPVTETDFCRYVIQQEKIHSIALKSMVNGNEKLAVKTINVFVKKHKD